jgi:hypothetical protein
MLLCQISYVQEKVNHFNLQAFLVYNIFDIANVFYQMVK